MRTVTLILVILCLICGSLASIGFIDKAEGQDCSSGRCVQVCEYDSLRLLPGTETTDDGKCRRVRCLQDFSVQITNCPSSTTLESCQNYKDNSKLPFPKCCEKTCKT